MSLVLATGNRGKVADMRYQLNGSGIKTYLMDDFGAIPDEETGTTYLQNAFIKAYSVASQTGAFTLADDSGLEVAHLDGRPGVYSARYAGEHATDEQNIEKLLMEMDCVDEGLSRVAVYACCIVIIDPTKDQMITTYGRCPGTIAIMRDGDQGFGYDPIFMLPMLNQTMATLSIEQRSIYTHRGIALNHAIINYKDSMSWRAIPDEFKTWCQK